VLTTSPVEKEKVRVDLVAMEGGPMLREEKNAHSEKSFGCVQKGYCPLLHSSCEGGGRAKIPSRREKASIMNLSRS